jgi:hypothetical protein
LNPSAPMKYHRLNLQMVNASERAVPPPRHH